MFKSWMSDFHLISPPLPPWFSQSRWTPQLSPAVPHIEEGLCRGDAPNGAHALHGLPRLDPQLEGDLLRRGESMGGDVYVENHG